MNHISDEAYNVLFVEQPIKYAYADGLAIMHADGDWQALEGVLSKDMATIDADMEAEAQHYKNGVSSLLLQQQGS